MRKRLGYQVCDLTTPHILADKARKNGDRVFLTYLPDGRVYTYRDIDQISNKIANGLRDNGIGKDSHVALLMENCPEFLLAIFALGKIGAVAVPINTASRGNSLAYFVNQSNSVALMVEEQLVERALEIQTAIPKIERFIVLPTGDKMPSVRTTNPRIVLNFRDLEAGSPAPPDASVKFSDLSSIMYTSGTTGPSKGNMFTQASTWQFGCGGAEASGYRFDDTYYVCLPLFHAMALHGNTLATLISDGSIALTRRFSASRFWSDARLSGSTIISALGSMINILWSAPPSPDDRSHNVRYCLTSPMPPFALEFEKRFGLRLISGYGLTDFGHAIAFVASDPVSKLGSCGRPLPGIQVRLVDDEDFDVPIGQPGEIILRCDNDWGAAAGYYNMPEATVAANRNGWFHTGDRAYADEDGYLFFVDRKKDAIRRRGENISAFEVEVGISRHPAVADVAVYPVASEMSEDEVAASIVLKIGASLSEIEILEHCQKNMSYFMVPRFIQFLPDLPRNMSQKVEKFKLKADAEEDITVFWDREKAGVVLKR